MIDYLSIICQFQWIINVIVETPTIHYRGENIEEVM